MKQRGYVCEPAPEPQISKFHSTEKLRATEEDMKRTFTRILAAFQFGLLAYRQRNRAIQRDRGDAHKELLSGLIMRSLIWRGVFAVLLLATVPVSCAFASDVNFSVLYAFEAPDPTTLASPLGSQSDTLPALGRDGAVYGMTYDGGSYGNGVIYRFDLESRRYTVLHTFSALDSNGNNEDGANPGVALTRGPDDLFYGMASFGGENGNGTIFSISATGEFTVLHTFSALDANGHNQDGAKPLRTVVVGNDHKLYGTTRIGGQHTCVPTPTGCGVAWVMDRTGGNFQVLHQFTPNEGHAASLLQAGDGLLYGSAVWPGTSLPSGVALPSGILFRMKPSGQDFEVLYRFSQTDANGRNTDGADPYEPLVETKSGVFYGAAARGGTNGSGVVFRYSLSTPDMVEIVHDFSAVNGFAGGCPAVPLTSGANSDGACPVGRLTLGHDGALYSEADFGGRNGNGVIYRIGQDGRFEVLYTFSATDPTTGANTDGALPDNGVILGPDNSLIGIAGFGGNGSSAGFLNSGGTLYQLKLDE